MFERLKTFVAVSTPASCSKRSNTGSSQVADEVSSPFSSTVTPFKVGDNAKIAANAVVLSEVPPNSTAVGVPARIVKRDGVKVSPAAELDQIHIPDPVSQQFCAMNAQIDLLNAKIKELEEKLTDK